MVLVAVELEVESGAGADVDERQRTVRFGDHPEGGQEQRASTDLVGLRDTRRHDRPDLMLPFDTQTSEGRERIGVEWSIGRGGVPAGEFQVGLGQHHVVDSGLQQHRQLLLLGSGLQEGDDRWCLGDSSIEVGGERRADLLVVAAVVKPFGEFGEFGHDADGNGTPALCAGVASSRALWT